MALGFGGFFEKQACSLKLLLVTLSSMLDSGQRKAAPIPGQSERKNNPCHAADTTGC